MSESFIYIRKVTVEEEAYIHHTEGLFPAEKSTTSSSSTQTVEAPPPKAITSSTPQKEEFVNVPVYQRSGRWHSKFTFQQYAPINKEYKDIIHNLYYARSKEGNDLLSVNGEPDFCVLKNRQVVGASALPKDYLRKISKYGWWRYY